MPRRRGVRSRSCSSRARSFPARSRSPERTPRVPRSSAESSSVKRDVEPRCGSRSAPSTPESFRSAAPMRLPVCCFARLRRAARVGRLRAGETSSCSADASRYASRVAVAVDASRRDRRSRSRPKGRACPVPPRKACASATRITAMPPLRRQDEFDIFERDVAGRSLARPRRAHGAPRRTQPASNEVRIDQAFRVAQRRRPVRAVRVGHTPPR